MLYHSLVTAALVLVIFNLILNLSRLRRPSKKSRLPENAPLISVLIPARNEEANIEACLNSLLQQDYPDFEVLVLDDNSEDSTAQITATIAERDSRVRLLRGQPLPTDWAGKPFACHQLAEHASGEWFLFVDADTIHEAHMLRSTLRIAIDTGAALLSGFPRQVAASLPQKIAIPVIYFVIISWLPLWWLQRKAKNRPSLAIGQFLLFPRERYLQIGGHESVKSRILEDVWLGAEIHRAGGRHMAIDLSPVVSSNMYRNMGDMWEGFTKWMYSVATLSTVLLVGLLTIGYLLYLAPFYYLWNTLHCSTTPSQWQLIILVQVFLILFMRWLVDFYFKEPPISTLLHPLGFSYLMLAVIHGLYRQLAGKGVSWKERVYEHKSGID